MKILRPYSITAGTLILFCVWAWIDMSNTDYRAGMFVGGRTTAGWFFIGSPFIIGFALLTSMLFSFVARRTRPTIGLLLLLGVFVPLIVHGWMNTTPTARLRTALGSEVPAGIQIQRITQYDSFNDGITIVGACTADRALVNQLVNSHSLQTAESGDPLRQLMPGEPIPEEGKFLAGNGLTLFYDENRSVMYFSRQLGQQRQREETAKDIR